MQEQNRVRWMTASRELLPAVWLDGALLVDELSPADANLVRRGWEASDPFTLTMQNLCAEISYDMVMLQWDYEVRRSERMLKAMGIERTPYPGPLNSRPAFRVPCRCASPISSSPVELSNLTTKR